MRISASLDYNIRLRMRVFLAVGVMFFLISPFSLNAAEKKSVCTLKVEKFLAGAGGVKARLNVNISHKDFEQFIGQDISLHVYDRVSHRRVGIVERDSEGESSSSPSFEGSLISDSDVDLSQYFIIVRGSERGAYLGSPRLNRSVSLSEADFTERLSNPGDFLNEDYAKTAAKTSALPGAKADTIDDMLESIDSISGEGEGIPEEDPATRMMRESLERAEDQQQRMQDQREQQQQHPPSYSE